MCYGTAASMQAEYVLVNIDVFSCYCNSFCFRTVVVLPLLFCVRYDGESRAFAFRITDKGVPFDPFK